ncbi:MlaD family protein, partial [Trichothermofontia sp.]
MRARTIREGTVGLMILVGFLVFGGLLLWVRDVRLGQRTYTIVVEFQDAGGVRLGSNVSYRGVRVGRVTQVRPLADRIEVVVEFNSRNLIIPQPVVIEANETGLIGEVNLDISPLATVPPDLSTSGPVAPDCDSRVIICQGDRLQGQIGVSFDALMRSTIRIADLFSNPELYNNIEAVTRNAAEAAAGVTELSKNFSSLSRSLQKELGAFSASARSLGNAAENFGTTTQEINALLVANRSNITATLTSLRQTSDQLRLTIARLTPIVGQVEQSELLNNLETLSANAAQASAHLKDLSASLNDPNNLLLIQQTLESARSTFQNVQKITADLDDLTGDPTLRENLRRLINGLSRLVSSTETLYHQVQVAQSLEYSASVRSRSTATVGTAPPAMPTSAPLAPESASPAPAPSATG